MTWSYPSTKRSHWHTDGSFDFYTISSYIIYLLFHLKWVASNFASPQENDQSPIRGGNDDNDDGPTGGEGMMKMKAQPVSMGNNLKDELNTPGVNIQGDGEIGNEKNGFNYLS